MAYNGWENYETWNIALWINNTKPLVDRYDEQAEEALELYIKDGAKSVLAQSMAEDYEANEIPSDVGRLEPWEHAINWREIAEPFVEAAGELD